MTAAWRWELVGGAIATAAILSFFAVEFVVKGGFPKGLTFLLMLLRVFCFSLSGPIKETPTQWGQLLSGPRQSAEMSACRQFC